MNEQNTGIECQPVLADFGMISGVAPGVGRLGQFPGSQLAILFSEPNLRFLCHGINIHEDFTACSDYLFGWFLGKQLGGFERDLPDITTFDQNLLG